MLAYAASRPRVGERNSSPHAMLAIIAAHVALAAVVMSAKMDLPPRTQFTKTVIDFIPLPKEPPPKPVEQKLPQPPLPSPIPSPRHPMPDPAPPPTWDPLPPGPGAGPEPGPGPQVNVKPNPAPMPAPTRAQLLTPPSELKPPYPASKLVTEEEALLKLRLTIDVNGRVVAVEPVAPADRVFLEAARRYLMAHWRYRPATEGGRAVATSTVITLQFQLDG